MVRTGKLIFKPINGWWNNVAKLKEYKEMEIANNLRFGFNRTVYWNILHVMNDYMNIRKEYLIK